ncbi:hypothetical protein GCM10007916_30860 [Psychromonas marina]|uniref:Cupin type-2 domain-containing protein n=1 Tax=Psychromonas marina TaxID=88364 RepID=A0ABQ6E3U9_9GAMM|nr:cupin domain-containing protein [Psychromonas marina]GLS92016.1 hypothetical protein GCM10007916_30860 [Psychromonas marina]
MSEDDSLERNSENSDIWKNYAFDPPGQENFSLRTTYPEDPDGVEVLMEIWKGGATEPAHHHPGDDLTVIVEGQMTVQFYSKGEHGLVKDGEQRVFNKGDSAYIKGNRIHSATYPQDCKLVYVHNKKFDFIDDSE